MCWHCDNPDKSGLVYLEEVALPTIREHGWLVQAVGGSSRGGQPVLGPRAVQ